MRVVDQQLIPPWAARLDPLHRVTVVLGEAQYFEDAGERPADLEALLLGEVVHGHIEVKDGAEGRRGHLEVEHGAAPPVGG